MKNGEAFSNGIEFEIWEQFWCAKCQSDAAFRSRGDDGCQILARGMFGGDVEITEWETDKDAESRGVWPRVRCTGFGEAK